MRRQHGVFRSLRRIRGEGGDDRLMIGVVVSMAYRWSFRSSFCMCAAAPAFNNFFISFKLNTELLSFELLRSAVVLGVRLSWDWSSPSLPAQIQRG
jgi:hypothetical protein